MRPDTIPKDYYNAVAIPFYVSEELFEEYQKVHCVRCGWPVQTLRNRIVSIVHAPIETKIVFGAGNLCRRCKQTYRFVLM